MASSNKTRRFLCPCEFTNLIEDGSSFTDYCFNQIVNINYKINEDELISILNTLYSDLAYTGFSYSIDTLNDYYILMDLVKMYYYFKQINPNINTWEEFVELYDLSKVISKLKCNNIDVVESVAVIDTCDEYKPVKR